MDQSEYQQIENDTKEWIIALSGEPIEDLQEGLKSGIALCKLVNGIRPNTILKINTYTAAYRQMENIDNFLKVCDKLGVPDSDRFTTEDLFYGNNIPKVVLTVCSLSKVANEKFSSRLLSVDLDALRDFTASSQKEDGKKRAAGQHLSLFEAGMKESQKRASSANRQSDRMIAKTEKSVDFSGSLGLLDANASKSQHMISEAKLSGTDRIILSTQKSVGSAELSLLESDASQKQKMISGVKIGTQDKIIMSKEHATATSELSLLESGASQKQKMISGVKIGTQDKIIRSTDSPSLSGGLGLFDSSASEKQKMISDAKTSGMDQIIRSTGAGKEGIEL